MGSSKALLKRYGSSSTTLPLWARLTLTAPFALVLVSDVVQVVTLGTTVYAAIATVFLVLSAFAAWVIVPHLWVPSDRAIRDERLEQAVGRQLRQELALREVREPGSGYDDVPTSPWHRRPAAPTRW